MAGGFFLEMIPPKFEGACIPMIDIAIAKLADYAEHTGLVSPCERTWAVNTILDVLKLDGYNEPERTWDPKQVELAPVLEELLGKGRCHVLHIRPVGGCMVLGD